MEETATEKAEYLEKEVPEDKRKFSSFRVGQVGEHRMLWGFASAKGGLGSATTHPITQHVRHLSPLSAFPNVQQRGGNNHPGRCRKSK
jgi:hypothetical protein